jgi:hypothetical protein
VRLATLVAGAPCSLGLAWMRSAVRAPSQVSPRDPTPAGPHHQRRNLDETLRLGRLAVRQLRLHVHMQLDFSGVVGIRERPRGSQPFGETQLVQARHRGQKRRGAVPVQPGAARTAEIRQAPRLASSRVRLRWGGARDCGVMPGSSRSRAGPTAMIFRGTE